MQMMRCCFGREDGLQTILKFLIHLYRTKRHHKEKRTKFEHYILQANTQSVFLKETELLALLK